MVRVNNVYSVYIEARVWGLFSNDVASASVAMDDCTAHFLVQ